MEQITLIYLENSDADYRKSCKIMNEKLKENWFFLSFHIKNSMIEKLA